MHLLTLNLNIMKTWVWILANIQNSLCHRNCPGQRSQQTKNMKQPPTTPERCKTFSWTSLEKKDMRLNMDCFLVTCLRDDLYSFFLPSLKQQIWVEIIVGGQSSLISRSWLGNFQPIRTDTCLVWHFLDIVMRNRGSNTFRCWGISFQMPQHLSFMLLFVQNEDSLSLDYNRSSVKYCTGRNEAFVFIWAQFS